MRKSFFVKNEIVKDKIDKIREQLIGYNYVEDNTLSHDMTVSYAGKIVGKIIYHRKEDLVITIYDSMPRAVFDNIKCVFENNDITVFEKIEYKHVFENSSMT